MATDRLRRRLRDLSPDSRPDLSTSFCTFGTPLPSITSHKKDANEQKPIWQQEARDKEGRRRFHGAFTGGFSAGYFNTVGSKEGWTPSSFRSSRKDKQKNGEKQRNAAGSRPEDFMDEEDLADYKAAQTVSTSISAPFGDGQLAGLRGEASADPLAKTLFGDVGVSQRDTVGFQLMRRMAWKDGQGLGPRVNAIQKARLLALISKGAPVASGSDVTLEDLKHLYAPPPTPLQIVPSDRKGRTGLGYVDDTLTLHQMLRPGYKASQSTAPSAAEDGGEVWPDTTRPLPSGFVLAKEPRSSEPTFPTEAVPPGWQPDPTRVWSRYTSTSGSKDVGKTAIPATRGELLGEARMPGPPPNIAAYLSEKARERLAASSNPLLPNTPISSTVPQYVEVPRLDSATAHSALSGHTPYPSDPQKQSRYQLYLNSQLNPGSDSPQRLPVPSDMTADQFTTQLREFAKSAGMFRPMSAAIASRFTKASASILEHDAKLMGVTPGFRFPSPASASTTTSDNVKDREPGSSEPGRELTTAQQAAKMGNFGHLTRKFEPWAPERLLCKRFGVPEPAIPRKTRGEGPASTQSNSSRPDDDTEDPFYGSTKSSKSKGKSGVQVDQHWERNKAHLQALAAGPIPLSLDAQSSSRPPAVEEIGETEEENVVGMGDDERQGKDTLTYTKPGMDVFRAIFASDEEGSEPEGAGEGTRPKMQDPTSGSGVVFQARSKRKDINADGEAEKAPTKPKRKKEKSSKKSLLTFDLDDDGDATVKPKKEKAPKEKLSFDVGGAAEGRKAEKVQETSVSNPKEQMSAEPTRTKPKGRVRASDLF